MSTRSTADVGVALRAATAKYGELKKAFEANNLAACESALGQLKVLFLQFPSFLDPDAMTATKQQEVLLVREVFEIAVLAATRKRDIEAFDSAYNVLRTYYTPEFDVGAQSERRLTILGLRLMRLLVASSLAAFHAELELISRADQQSLYVKYPAQLERYLAEGSFNKLLQGQGRITSDEFKPFVAMLEDTVRHEIATCVPVSYSTLTLEAAQRLLMLKDEAAVMAIARKHNWQLSVGGGNAQAPPAFVFDAAASKVETMVPFKRVLGQQLKLAVHLQSVV